MQIRKYITNKRVITVVLVLIFIALTLGNIYSFWIKPERQRYLEVGAIQMRNAIYNAVVRDGRVTVGNSEGEQIILVPLPQ